MKLRVFKCDTCGKNSEIREEGENCFPYELGWKYIHRLGLKPNPTLESSEVIKKLQNEKSEMVRYPSIYDFHFCSKDCLIKFVEACLDGKY